jgi:hypothetical protein
MGKGNALAAGSSCVAVAVRPLWQHGQLIRYANQVMKPSEAKLRSFIVLGSFVMIVCMLAIVSGLPRREPAPSPDKGTLFMGIAAACVVACVVWTWIKVWPRAEVGETPTPAPLQKFLSSFIVALALAEVPSILGFTMAPALDELRYAFFAASLACMLFLLLPALLRYWSIADSKQ